MAERGRSGGEPRYKKCRRGPFYAGGSPLGQFLCGRRRDLSRPTEDLVGGSGYALGFLRRDPPGSQIVQGIEENISQLVAVARF